MEKTSRNRKVSAILARVNGLHEAINQLKIARANIQQQLDEMVAEHIGLRAKMAQLNTPQEERNWIIFRLRSQGWRQSAIAKELDVSQATVSRAIRLRAQVEPGRWNRVGHQERVAIATGRP